MRKQTLKNVVFAVLLFCMFVGLMPQIAADYNTAQAAAANVYYDFKKGHPGTIASDADGRRSAFEALTYDVVAGRNSDITSGAWAYNGFTATGTNNTSTYASYVSTADSYRGILIVTADRDNVINTSFKFKGLGAGKYIPYLNIDGDNYPDRAGIITARIYASGSSTVMYEKEIYLASYPDDENYIPLSNEAQSFGTGEYILEIEINKVATYAMLNGLLLHAADTDFVSSIYPTNDLGVYEVEVGATEQIPFTQLLSNGTTDTTKRTGWNFTSGNSYVTADVNSSSHYFTIEGVKATSTPQTIEFSLGTYAKAKINVIVRAAGYTDSSSTFYYDFEKALPPLVSASEVYTIGKHITYGNTAVGGYGEIKKWTGATNDDGTSLYSYPWKVSSIADTANFSPLYQGYGVRHTGTGNAEIKIQVPTGGTYMPQLIPYTTTGVAKAVTVSIINSSGTTVSTMTVPAGTTTAYNLASKGISLSAQEYTIRFNKTASGSNFYDGIKLVKTSNTTVTLNPNGGTATGNKPTVVAANGFAMPPVNDAIPTKTGYTFNGYYDTTDTSGTRYYNQNGKSVHAWDKTSSTATLYASWNVNSYTVAYNANGGSGTTASSSHTYDTAKALTANGFSRTGYTFLGWSTNKSATSATYTDGESVKNLSSTNGATVNLYAVWKVNTYTVTLDAQEATTAGTASVTATYDSAMPAITAPTRIGYIFDGYYTAENGEGEQYYTADGTSAKTWDKSSDTILYANWIQGEVTITQIEDKTINVEEELTFTVEGSSTAPGDITYTAENLPEGATFDTATGEFNWTPGIDQVGEYTIIFRGSDGLNYAEVTVKVEVLEITTAVTLDDGTDTTEITATYGSAMPAITAPTKSGYIFDGYYDGENGAGTKYYNADGTSAKNWDKKDASVTLYAKWIEGDDRFGTRIGGFKNYMFQNSSGETMFRMYLLAGIDSLNYDEVGFEVTVDGVTKKFSTRTVFSKIYRQNGTYISASTFGPKCIRGIVISTTFSLAYKDKVVTVRPYALDFEGNYIYGKSLVINGVYDG